MANNTKYLISNYDVDTGHDYVQKSFLISNYPDILPHVKMSSLWMCGYSNDFGQLGTGSVSGLVTSFSPVPVVGGGTVWKQVSCGFDHSAGVKADGTLWAWGWNGTGAVGDGTITHKSTPVQIMAGSTTWKHVCCSSPSTYAIKQDGTLWAWGDNFLGQLGDGTTVNKSSPIQIGTSNDWASLPNVIGGRSAAAIKSDGSLWMWGQNDNNQLGTNDADATTFRSSPVQVIGGTDWAKISCGYYHTAGIKTDGTLWGWGEANDGQLGFYSPNSQGVPVQIFGQGSRWIDVSVAEQMTVAIRDDNTMWVCGYNIRGQLGVGDGYQWLGISSPVQVLGGGSLWKQVSCGYHAVGAVKTDGTLWVWGNIPLFSNPDYSGFDENLSSPTQIIGGGTNWKYVSVGGRTVMGLREELDW